MNSNPTNPNAKLSEEEFVRQRYPDADIGIVTGAIFKDGYCFKHDFLGHNWADAVSRQRAEEGIGEARECVFCGFKWFPKIDDEPCPYHDELHIRKPESTPVNQSDEGKPTESARDRRQVRPEIYGNPIYLAGLLRRIKSAYFDKEWKAVERLFEAEIEEMENRIPLAPSTPVSAPQESTMKYEVAKDNSNENEGGWRVEAIDFDGDGDCFVTIFCGPDAEARAREYAAWKSVGQEETKK